MVLLITLHFGEQTNVINTSTTYLHGSMYNNNTPDVVTWFNDHSIPKVSLSECVGYNTTPVNATLECQPTTIKLPTLPADLLVSSYILNVPPSITPSTISQTYHAGPLRPGLHCGDVEVNPGPDLQRTHVHFATRL